MTDIFWETRNAGLHDFGAPGARWYPEFEISYLLTALRRRGWDDAEQVRLRRHVLVSGPTSGFKGSATARFLKKYMGARPSIERHDAKDHATPFYLEMGGRTGWERACGTFNARSISIPLLAMADFYFIPEFLSFLGFRIEDQARKMYSMNEVMEENRVSVDLAKSGDLSDAAIEKAREKLKEFDVGINLLSRTLYYEVPGSFIACSHPFDQKQHDIFVKSGLISRWQIPRWTPSDSEYEVAYENGPPLNLSPNHKLILDFNRRAWAMRFHRVNAPPAYMTQKVQSIRVEGFRKIEAELGLSPQDTRTMRDIAESMRLLTAKAFADHISDHEEEDGYEFETLSYDDDDVKWVCAHVEQSQSELHKYWLSVASDKSRDEGPKEETSSVFSRFVDTLPEDSFVWRDFADWANSNLPRSSRATLFRYLSKWTQQGLINRLNGRYVFGVAYAAMVSGTNGE